MSLDLRQSTTATGKPNLIVGEKCDWNEFPGRAQQAVDHFRMKVIEKIDTPCERMWLVSRDDATFCISWDDWCSEVSIMAWEQTPDDAVLGLPCGK